MERSVGIAQAGELEVGRGERRVGVGWPAARELMPWAVVLLFIVASVAFSDNPYEPRAGAPAMWALHLERMEEALARQDARGAIRPWNEAYSAALKSQGWEGMAAVGQAYFRLVERVGDDMGTAALTARPIVVRGIFESVLTRAHQQRSVEGVLRAAEGFTAIGDAAMAERCRQTAKRLGATTSDSPPQQM
jgi:hypothetical protein